MKVAGAVMLALVEIGSGVPTGERVSLRSLTESPRDYLGKKIVVQAIGCVDNPKGGFVCVATVGGQALRISASTLGAKTALSIAERLIGDCKGTANLTRPACRVDIELEPTSGFRDVMDTPNGSMPITIVVSPQIEMYVPARRPTGR